MLNHLLVRLSGICLLVACGLWGPWVYGWSPRAQERLALDAARLAPPDLYRQLARNRSAFLQGTTDPFKQPADLHFKNASGSGRLDAVLRKSVDEAILSIRLHRPFNEVAYRLGVVSHYLADANYPLSVADGDPQERLYAADFLRYLDSAEPRFGVVFYGFRQDLTGQQGFSALLAETLGRSRRLYPMVGREYRRVGFKSGVQMFDDRSTAYAVGALAYSHAISDIAEMLRYIWIEAGGIDSRRQVPVRGQQWVQIPRSAEGN